VVTTVLTRAVARMLLAPVLVVSVAVLVKGYVDPGDGFAAGVIAALGILVQYTAFGRTAVEGSLPVRRAPQLAIAGLLVAVLVTVVPWVLGRAPLEHLPAPGSEPVHVGSLELVTAFAFDVGVFGLVVGTAVGTIHAIAVTMQERDA